jgi:hypothetical protein
MDEFTLPNPFITYLNLLRRHYTTDLFRGWIPWILAFVCNEKCGGTEGFPHSLCAGREDPADGRRRSLRGQPILWVNFWGKK